MILNIGILICFCLFSCIKSQQSYYSWIVGNPADFKLPDESILNGGVLLAGGSTDQDSAMRWFLSRAHGGDVIVLRNGANESVSEYPTADRYNDYLYSELGIQVDSVETIFLNSRNVANNLEVVEKVMQAEAIFFTGGDQAFYYSNIQDTLLQDALNYLISTKKVVIGGSSAGCAIQGEFGFSADFDTITSKEALQNPYDQRITIRRNLLIHKLLNNTVTDTHYSERDRRGRHVTFMARIYKDYLTTSTSLVSAIGVDEKTVVCVEPNGIARVFGVNSAYFIQQSSLADTPEICEPKKWLDWYRGRKALKVYRIFGSTSGERYFDLSSWDKGFGGTWSLMYVDQGTLSIA